MEEGVLDHLVYKMANAPIQSYPYPHFFIQEVFPPDFYQEILEYLPETSYYLSMPDTGRVAARTYQERFVFDLNGETMGKLPFAHLLFWSKFSQALQSRLWISMLMDKFLSHVKEQIADRELKVESVAELIRDHTQYAIGPHTDHPARLLTLLFYLPKDDTQKHLGTSIFRHEDPHFECPGMTHHSFERFKKIYTAPFVPNSVFGFLRTSRSFHGVEQLQEPNINRNLLNYYLKCTS